MFMEHLVQKKYPSITALLWHRDQYYSFFIPSNWHRLQWSDGREGVIYAPDSNDLLTLFAVDIKDLGMSVKPADLDDLAEGFAEGIAQLPDSHIEHRLQKVTGEMLEIEARYTFLEQGATRKCWTRMFYFRSHQIVMTAQGATPEKYDYWLPWFFEAMMTAKVHSAKPESPF